MQIGLVILAAGASSRMGFVKQNIVFKDKTMLQHLLHEALMSSLAPVTIVTGANKKDIVPNLKDLPITIIDNQNAAKGMGSSIKMGLVGSYMAHKDLEAIIYITSDMPLVNTNYLHALALAAETLPEALIVASSYENTFGIPVLFKRAIFDDVLSLNDEDGAKKLIEKYKSQTHFIAFPEGKIDLDTPADLESFVSSHPHFFTQPT
jgi:molybdenum cofactor cytidylyltransferase